MATAVSSSLPIRCTPTMCHPSASVAGRPAGCSSSVKPFPGTTLSSIKGVGICRPLHAVFPLQLVSKEVRHHFAPAVPRAATRQLTECAPREQGEVLGTGPIVRLFGPGFISGGAQQVDNAVALSLGYYQEPLIEAPLAGATLPLDASCHILTGFGEAVEDWSLQAHIDALSKDQAMLEASFQAPHGGPLLLPDSLDLRLSSLSPIAPVDEGPPKNTVQKLQNMLMGTARLLGALVLASALAFCTPHPALAARSMGRAGGGGFSSSRSSGGSSRSSSSSGGSSGSGFHWGSTPSSHTSTQSSHSNGQSGGHTSGHSPSHSDSHGKSGIKARAAWKSSGKPPVPKPSPSSSGKRRWLGAGSHVEAEEPHLNPQILSDTSASIHLHLGGPTQPQFSSHPGAYHYSDTHDRLLRAFFRSLSGENSSKETGGQPKAGPDAPRPKAADTEAQNLTFDEILNVLGIMALEILVVTVIALLAKGLIDKMMERETSSDENTGTARKADGDVMAEASRAVERMRADVSKSAPEGSCLYDVDTDVKNLLTVVKIQVALLGQAKSVQLLQTLLVILRHSTYWAYGNAQMLPLRYDVAERRYQQIALEERSKAEQETLVNKGGKLTKTPSIRPSDEEPPPNEFIVVTILAAIKGRLEARSSASRVAARENVKGALQGLSQVQPDDLEVLDILWVPQEDDDTLTHAELIENFTDLSPM